MCHNELQWVGTVKENAYTFLRKISEEDFSYFRYSYSGDMFNVSHHWGLGNLVFATKILYITGLLTSLKQIKQENLSTSILRFSSRDGFIYDPCITQLSIGQKISNLFGKLDIATIRRIEDVKRAETRQAFSALYLLGKAPTQPFLHIPYNKKKLEEYLLSFDWSRPWSAGSHFSHLLFFLKFNSRIFNYHVKESQELIQYAVEWISQLQSKDDGCWYQGQDVPLYEKINGAMKILTGFHAAGIYHFLHAEKLLDTALSAINDREACSHFNIVYVLYGCHQIVPEYRKQKTYEFLRDRLKIYREFYHPAKGGFSFNKNKANDIYYGKKISLGKNEPDIHGTIMFIWGLAIINQIMDIGIDFKIPLT